MKLQQLALITLVASLTMATPMIHVRVSISDDVSPQYSSKASDEQPDRSLFLAQRGSATMFINDDDALKPEFAGCQLLCVPESKLECPKDMVRLCPKVILLSIAAVVDHLLSHRNQSRGRK